MKKLFKYFFVILFLVFASNFVYATSTIRANDEWSANEGTSTDGWLWINDNINVYTDGMASTADMICYDWDNNGQFDNCYWDNNGCGGSCNADSCNYFSIPGNMNDGWKIDCSLEENCQEGVDVPERICDGCTWDTSTRKQKTIAARIYHDCDNSQGARNEEVVGTFIWSVADSHKYDCDDYEGSYNLNVKDYEGYASIIDTDISSNIPCPANYKCSEYFDDEVSSVKTYTGFTNPCKLGDGSTSTFACTQNNDCASNNCAGDRYNYFHNCDSDGSNGFVVDKIDYDNSCGGNGYYDEGGTTFSWEDTTCSVEVGANYICDNDLEEETSSYDPMVVCRLKEYATCTSSSQCWNDNGGYDCMGGAGNKICTTGANGKNCYNNDDSQCDSGRCDTTCQTKLDNGNDCDDESDCTSNECVHDVCRNSDPFCGDDYCDSSENIGHANPCAEDCCDYDFTSDDDSVCHAECSLYGWGTFTSGCDNLASGSASCVDDSKYRTCCKSGITYCEAGYKCDGGACITGPSGDLHILDVIPIQVVPDVDMIKDKSGIVKVIAINNGSNEVSGTVSVTFNGGSLPPIGSATQSMPVNVNKTFYFTFVPDVSEDNLAITATIDVTS